MRNGSLGRVSKSQRKRCYHGKSSRELICKDIIGDVKNLSIEDGSIVVNRLEYNSVSERLNAELLQQGSLGSGNLVSLSDKMSIVGHLNLSTGNLSRNLKGLEESCLSGITSSGSLLYDNVSGGDTSNTGRGGTYVGLKNLTNFSKISVGENKSDVSTAESLKLANRCSLVLLAEFTDALTHHGVLSHKKFSLSTEGLTGLLKLGRSYIVYGDNESLGVSSKEFLKLNEVFLFAFSG
mmetsp:Transcript_14551/g.21698  ORF Transcript_14551/g.21698 Transcript_14551/m.21698 type:complete len:237 (+) Transcript_14551:596-1306(+)